jgi:hypothetical protein
MSVEKYKAQFREAMDEFAGFMEQDSLDNYSLIHWYEGLRFLLDMTYLTSAERYTMKVYRWRMGEIPILLRTVTISKE